MTLVTLGVIVMLLGIHWLMALGFALVILTAIFSQRQQHVNEYIKIFMICAAGAVVLLVTDLWDGVAFTQRTLPIWYRVTLIGWWIWIVAREFYFWRRNRSLT